MRSTVKAPKISVVTVKRRKELVKVLACGRSRDYRAYCSDTPLVD